MVSRNSSVVVKTFLGLETETSDLETETETLAIRSRDRDRDRDMDKMNWSALESRDHGCQVLEILLMVSA